MSFRAVTGEEISQEELGGAMTHNSKSGVAHFAAEDDRDCLVQIRKMLSFLPSNHREAPPRVETGDDPHASGSRARQHHARQSPGDL